MALAEQSNLNIKITTVPILSGAGTDPLAWIPSKLSDTPYWFWEIPEDKTSWVGIGEAYLGVFEGASRFKETESFFAELVELIDWDKPEDAPLPRFACGFSFDQNSYDEAWSFLSNGRLILPEIQILKNDKGTWLMTVNSNSREEPNQSPPNPFEPLSLDPKDWSTNSEREHYKKLIDTALKAISNGELEKAVPCRSIFIEQVPEIPGLLSTLRNSYPACATFCIARGEKAFLGSTPEKLASSKKGGLQTVALAGSAPRSNNFSLDSALAQGLLTSPKERREHSLVVDEILNRLTLIGLKPEKLKETGVLKISGIQHLYTPIGAVLNKDVGLLNVVSSLHPTPAVSGHPLERADQLRQQYENFDRGWFAGPIGWLDISGDGEFRVALRSGLVDSTGSTLFAGAGVVEGSDPDRELLETDMKLKAMLNPIMTQQALKSV